jgi:predicted amidophosphoribosyltransferase
MCEDYPCCGHERGGCPSRTRSGKEIYRCVECGKNLRANASSSICAKCIRRANQRFYETGEMWPDSPSDY